MGGTKKGMFSAISWAVRAWLADPSAVACTCTILATSLIMLYFIRPGNSATRSTASMSADDLSIAIVCKMRRIPVAPTSESISEQLIVLAEAGKPVMYDGKELQAARFLAGRRPSKYLVPRRLEFADTILRQAVANSATDNVLPELLLLDRFVRDHDWVARKCFTAADILSLLIVHPYLAAASVEILGKIQDSAPTLRPWVERCCAVLQEVTPELVPAPLPWPQVKAVAKQPVKWESRAPEWRKQREESDARLLTLAGVMDQLQQAGITDSLADIANVPDCSIEWANLPEGVNPALHGGIEGARAER